MKDLEKNINIAKCIRQVENWSRLERHHRFDKPTFNKEKMVKEIPTYSPKLSKLIESIKELDEEDIRKEGKNYKHFIFSDLKKGGVGAKVIASGLIASGFTHCFTPQLKIVKPPPNPRNETLGLLSSTPIYNNPVIPKHVKDILKIYNSRDDNIHGEVMRFIILDSGFKEGIDLFDVKYVHIFENQLTEADLTQAVGRATRSCGQKGLNFVPNEGWKLYVYLYESINPNTSKPIFNDYIKYSGINLDNHIVGKNIEKMAIMSAVDHDLTFEIHKFVKNEMSGGNNAIENIGCSESDKCGSRSTKTVPFSLALLKIVYRHLNKRVPYRFNKKTTKDQRAFYCKLLQTDEKFCSLVNAVRRDPSIIPKEIKQKKNNSLPQKSRENPETEPEPTENSVVEIVQREKKEEEKKKPINIQDILDSIEDISNAENMEFDEFREQINRIFKAYKYKPLKIENLCDVHIGNATKFPKFTESQDFVTHYFTPKLYTKGILLWHSVGTGKTCTAISLKSFLFERLNYTVIWVTRRQLRNDIWKNMYEMICDRIIQEKYEEGDTAETLKKHLYNRFITPMTYRQFSNMLAKKNEFYNRLKRLNGEEDILRNTLVIIDEAHKLYSKDLEPLEKPDMDIIEDHFKKSTSCKIVLMTGTPIADDAMELIKLLNLINKTQLPTNLENFREQFMEGNNFTPIGKKRFQNTIKGLISYLDRRYDPRQFTQPVHLEVKVPISQGEMHDNYCSLDKQINEILCKEITNNKNHEMNKEELNKLRQTIEYLTTTFSNSSSNKTNMQSIVKDMNNTLKAYKNELKTLEKIVSENEKKEKQCHINTKKTYKECEERYYSQGTQDVMIRRCKINKQ